MSLNISDFPELTVPSYTVKKDYDVKKDIYKMLESFDTLDSDEGGSLNKRDILCIILKENNGNDTHTVSMAITTDILKNKITILDGSIKLLKIKYRDMDKHISVEKQYALKLYQKYFDCKADDVPDDILTEFLNKVLTNVNGATFKVI